MKSTANNAGVVNSTSERHDTAISQDTSRDNKKINRFMVSPSVILLFLWMVVPLSMTIYFSTIRYNLLNPGANDFVGLENYEFFVEGISFFSGMGNTLLLVGSVLVITVVFGVLISLLVNQAFMGRGIVRILLISPFFIMPTVTALIWKNLLLHPVSGVLAAVWRFFGAQPVDWFAEFPMFSIIVIVSWRWLPFAILLLMTALQSLDQEQQEAARLDGAGRWALFYHLTLPHLARPIAVVVMLETIFLLSVFAEIFTTTQGGPGFETTNLAYLIFSQALLQFDVGLASAGGVIAVILANIAAIFLIRLVGKSLTEKQ